MMANSLVFQKVDILNQLKVKLSQSTLKGKDSQVIYRLRLIPYRSQWSNGLDYPGLVFATSYQHQIQGTVVHNFQALLFSAFWFFGLLNFCSIVFFLISALCRRMQSPLDLNFFGLRRGQFYFDTCFLCNGQHCLLFCDTCRQIDNFFH